MTRPVPSPVAGLTCVCDAPDVVDQIVSAEVAAALRPLLPLVSLIYASDSFEAYETDYRARAQFVFVVLPGAEGAAALASAVRLAMRLVDAFVSVSLSVHARGEAKERRRKRTVKTAKELREEQDAKVSERKLAALQEERDRVAQLSGKERAKAEEKIRKRENKAKVKVKLIK